MRNRFRSMLASHWTRHKTGDRRTLLKATGLSMVAAVSLLAWSDIQTWAEEKTAKAKTEHLLEDLRAWPAMDRLFSDRPELVLLVEQAVRRDLKSGVSPVARKSETYDVLWHLRSDYFLPKMMAADNGQILDLWRTHSAALRYIAGWSSEQCVVFLELGLAFLDEEGIAMSRELREYSSSLIEAYEASQVHEAESFSTAEVTEIWRESMNFRERHWHALMDPVAATNDTYCNTGIRMATNLHLVPEGERVTYARTIVGQRHF